MERSDNFLHEASYLDQEGQLRTSRLPVVQEIAHRGIKHLTERFIRVYPQYDHDPITSFLADDVSAFLPSISMANLLGPVQTRGPSPRAGKSLGHVRNQGPRCTLVCFARCEGCG